MINIVCLGECMREASDNSTFRFGGDSLNTALYLARVSPKERIAVSYATAIGQDKESDQLIEQWQQEGIDTRFVSTISGKPLGKYSISTSEKGERNFIYDRDNSAAKYYFSRTNKSFEAALLNKSIDYLYFTGISLAILSDQDCQHLFKLLNAFKRKGGRIIFDNNYRPILWKNRQAVSCYQQAMTLADIAFLTDVDEYALYGGSSVASILARYPYVLENNSAELVIKQGDKPCLIRASDKNIPLLTIASPPIPNEQIVDTCAAGDAFAAGYIAKRLLGDSMQMSAQFAHSLAGRVIQYSGAIIPPEHMSDLKLEHRYQSS